MPASSWTHRKNMRSRRQSIFKMQHQNKFLFLAMVVSLVLTTAAIFILPIAAAFEFEPISLAEYFAAMGLAVVVIPIVEIVKFFSEENMKLNN